MGLQVSYLLGHAPETPQAQSMAVMPLDPAAFRNYFMCNASRGFVVEDLHRFVCNYTDEQYGQLRLEIGDLILNSNQDLNEVSRLMLPRTWVLVCHTDLGIEITTLLVNIRNKLAFLGLLETKIKI